MVKIIIIPTFFFLWCVSASSFSVELGRAVIPSQGVQLIVETFVQKEVSPSHGSSFTSDNQQTNLQDKKLVGTKKLAINQAGTKLSINRMTDLRISVHSLKEGQNLSSPYELVFFDARMPEHNHGMVVKPKISQLDDLHWKVEGFKLHMKGLWQFYLTVKVGQTEEKVGFDLDI
ncbi:MAG: hypothetical protein AB8G05_02655 [Oligoflexales bacterium]